MFSSRDVVAQDPPLGVVVEPFQLGGVVERLGMPSMWGQSDPKITRSAPMSSTASLTSSSQNGLIQMWRRKISTGSSEK